VKSDSSRGSKHKGDSVDRLQLDSTTGYERPSIPSLELNKKAGENGSESEYHLVKANESNITLFSRHLG
jgi:hypothetical protein